jgi:hypothetical protein
MKELPGKIAQSVGAAYKRLVEAEALAAIGNEGSIPFTRSNPLTVSDLRVLAVFYYRD